MFGLIKGIKMNLLKHLKLRSGFFIVFLSFFVTPSTFATGAQGSLMPVSVPALSGPMLMVLSLLLIAVAIKITKQKGGAASKYIITIVGFTALVVGGGGVKLVSDTYASGPTVFLVPGTPNFTLLDAPLNPDSGFHGAIENNSGQPVTIQSLEAHDGSVCNFGMGFCQAVSLPLTSPLTIPDGQFCQMSCNAISPP